MAVSWRGRQRPSRADLQGVPWSMVAIAAVLLAIQIATTGNPAMEETLFGVPFMLLDLLGAIVCVRVTRKRELPSAVRRPWGFMALALLLHLVSLAGFAIGDVAGLPPVEWAGIIARISAAPMLLAAVLAFPMRRMALSERYKLLLDVSTVAGGGFMVLWYFIIGPALTTGKSAKVAVSLAGFPVGDLVVIFGMCVVLMRGASLRRHPLTTLLTGLVCFLGADVWYSYAELQHHGRHLPLPMRVALLGGGVLIVTAAVQQLRQAASSAQVVAKPSAERSGGISHLPNAGLAVGYVLLLFAAARERSLFPWGGLVIGVIVMTGATAIRQLIAMRENHRLVITDSLTGLANRVRLGSRLAQALQRRRPVAVLMIDLDGFKKVNDTLGHEAGDRLLVAFADALRHNVRPTDTASRLGGDEFAVVLPDIDGIEQAQAIAERVLTTASVPVSLGDTMVPVRGSIGIALSRPGDDTAALLHRADVAMYAAKRAGNHGWQTYAETMEFPLGHPAELARELVQALAQDQLRLFYQPIVALHDGAVTAVKALVRWEHPIHGMLTADAFRPAVEVAGVGHDIGMWALTETSRQVNETGQDASLRAHIQLSDEQLRRPGLATDILGALARTNLAPTRLVLELPDTISAGVTPQAGDQLDELRRHGVRIAADDFNAGYRVLDGHDAPPIDLLMRDSCYLAELDDSRQGTAVADAVVQLSRLLHPTRSAHPDQPFPSGELLGADQSDSAAAPTSLVPAAAPAGA